MAPESITQDRIYHAIKAEYLEGRFQPGTRIELQLIADRHRASTTPVREAIHRLVGERLIESRSDGGFQIAVPDALRLSHLYAWFGHQILGALHSLHNASLARATETFRRNAVSSDMLRQTERVDAVFQEIASATGNLELVGQIAAANERLRYPRLAEASLFPNIAQELQNLTRNGHQAGVSNVRRRVTAYHDRRIRRATEIAFAVRHPGIDDSTG